MDDAEPCFIDHGATAVATATAALAEAPPVIVLIGAWVRGDPAELLLLERLVNLAHEWAWAARLCFSTGPGGGAAAPALAPVLDRPSASA